MRNFIHAFRNAKINKCKLYFDNQYCWFFYSTHVHIHPLHELIKTFEA